MTYTYDPKKIKEHGKDRLRFELGDTQTDGGAETCALSDEEYEGLLDEIQPGKRAWLRVKLDAVNAILHKMAFEVDTKIDVLEYKFGDRAERWQKLKNTLEKELLGMTSVPLIDASIRKTPPYFHTGMQGNPNAADSPAAPRFPFKGLTK